MTMGDGIDPEGSRFKKKKCPVRWGLDHELSPLPCMVLSAMNKE